MKNFLQAVGMFLLFSNCYALDLAEARNKNMVEELATGYLQAKDPGAEALANDINEKRKAHYTQISKDTGATLDHVAMEAAKKIQEKLHE